MEQSEIIIGFSKPKDRMLPVFSWIIRLVEGTQYSHVYIKWYSKYVDRYVIYQAQGTMVHFIGNKLFNEGSEPIEEYAIDINDDNKRDLIRWCMDQAGVSYGISYVFGIAWVRLVRWITNKRIRNPFRGGEQFCSKLVGQALRDILDIEIKEDLETAGPKDINNIVKNLPGVEPVDKGMMGATNVNLVRYRYSTKVDDINQKDIRTIRKELLAKTVFREPKNQ